VTVLVSALDTRGAQYAARREATPDRLSELDARHAKVLAGADPGDQVQAGDVLAIVEAAST
jgi:biotin carboxyl carrier protein